MLRPLEGFGPQDRDLGLKAGIWALRLKYGPGGWGDMWKEKKKEEKIPHMCESIGHRSLWGRCPKRGELDCLVVKVDECANK